MGQTQSVIKIEEAQSKVTGLKCYTTGPLDELCDYDRLWEELRAGLRTDFVKDPTLKRGEVTEISNDEFKVSKIHDGEKLKLPVAELPFKICYILDQEGGVLFEEIRDPALDFLQDFRILRTLRDPLSIEISSQRMRVEERRSGPLVQLHIHMLLKHVVKRDVVTEANHQSIFVPHPGQLSAYSEPLEKDIESGDALYKALLQCTKLQEHNELAKDVTVSEVRKDGKKDYFTTWFTVDGETLMKRGLAQSNEDVKMYQRVEAVEEGRIFSSFLHDAKSHTIVDTYWTVAHNEPLCVEAWAHTPVPHDMDPDVMRRVLAASTLNDVCCRLLERLEKQ